MHLCSFNPYFVLATKHFDKTSSNLAQISLLGGSKISRGHRDGTVVASLIEAKFDKMSGLKVKGRGSGLSTAIMMTFRIGFG